MGLNRFLWRKESEMYIKTQAELVYEVHRQFIECSNEYNLISFVRMIDCVCRARDTFDGDFDINIMYAFDDRSKLVLCYDEKRDEAGDCVNRSYCELIR